MDKYRLGQIAYNAYGEVTNFKNFQGNPMPVFDELPEIIQTAWQKAAEKIVEITEAKDE